MRPSSRRNLRYYLFLVPAFVFLGLFVYWPIVWSVYLSLMRWNLLNPLPRYTGLENYETLLRSETFWQIVLNTGVYLLGSIVPTLILAVLLAILLDETVRGRGVLIYSLFYPTLIPMAAAAMIWVFLYSPQIGLINQMLGAVGLPRPGWLGSAETSLLAIVIMSIWKYVGFYTLIVLAGLQVIDGSLYEHAVLEGAGWWRRHLHITLPLLSPTLLFIGVVGLILSFRVFAPVHLMTEGGPGISSNVFVYYLYENGFKFLELGVAFAMTVILVVALLGAVVLLFRIIGPRIHYEAG